MVEAGIGHPVQGRVFGVGDQQAVAFQHAHDAAAEAVEQAIEFIAGGPAGAVEDRPVAAKSVGAVQEQHVHDCRDAGGRATQEQLPRWGFRFRAEPKRWVGVTAPVLAPDATVRPECCTTKVEIPR